VGATGIDRAACENRDANDPLRAFREEFLLPPETIYLDGNSLGPRPKGAAERAQEVIAEEWGSGLIKSWNTADWFGLPVRLGQTVSEIIGGGSGSAVVTDTTSVNLFKAASAALRIQAADAPGRRVILTQRENFPSDIYMLEGLAAQLGDGCEVRLVDDAEVTAGFPTELTDEVALVVLTHVNYRTGRLFDMGATTWRSMPAAPWSSGTCAIRREQCRSIWPGPVRTWPWAAPTSSSTADRAHRPSSGSPRRCRTASRSRCRGGWAMPSPSRCHRSTHRPTGSAVSSPARRASCRCRWPKSDSTSPPERTWTPCARNRWNCRICSSTSSSPGCPSTRSRSSPRVSTNTAVPRSPSPILRATR